MCGDSGWCRGVRHGDGVAGRGERDTLGKGQVRPLPARVRAYDLDAVAVAKIADGGEVAVVRRGDEVYGVRLQGEVTDEAKDSAHNAIIERQSPALEPPRDLQAVALDQGHIDRASARNQDHTDDPERPRWRGRKRHVSHPCMYVGSQPS